MKKVLGLVVEFNPLHNGHMYFIQKAKELTTPDVTIAVMSSHFTMRGDISVINKYERTKLMLEAGIDLIVELPFLAAVQSSDYFTTNAILTLRDFGVTDIVFGAELSQKEELLKIYETRKNPLFDTLVKEHLSSGNSYSAACYLSFQDLLTNKELTEQVTKPNNMLALGYISAIREFAPHIDFHPIQRISANYYDQTIQDEKIASADAIRQALRKKQDIASFVPENTYKAPLIHEEEAKEKLYQLLKGIFIRDDISCFQHILGVSEGIENRIQSMLDKATNYDHLVDLVKTRRYTPNKVKRLFLHILMNTSKEYESTFQYYLRVLGMSPSGEKHLKTLPKEIKKQIITSPKNITNCVIIEYEKKATKLYSYFVNDPTLLQNEYLLPIKKESNTNG